jgi:hypothetical protein
MRLAGRIVVAGFLSVCGLLTWGVGNFLIVLFTGKWRGGAPTATSTSYWIIVPYTAVFVIMMFFVIRHIDRSLRG